MIGSLVADFGER